VSRLRPLEHGAVDERPTGNNSTVLTGDVAKQVSKLKRELDGEIVVYGSIQLVRTLLEHELVDELRLMIHPVVLGAGERLFGETGDKKPMRLVGAQADDDVAFLTYEPPAPARDATGAYLAGRAFIAGSRTATTLKAATGRRNPFSVNSPTNSTSTSSSTSA
jgi:hypothetical protein